MDRRHFIGAMLGAAAATALPSEIWPFRKIFLPPASTIIAVPNGIEPAVRLLYDIYSHQFREKETGKLFTFDHHHGTVFHHGEIFAVACDSQIVVPC